LLLADLPAQAAEPADPPGRIARLNYVEGNVTYAPAGDNEWTDAELNRPLVPGDKLWTDKGVRAELQAGSSVVRMDGRTQLTVLALDDRSVQLSVTQGTVYARVRNLPEGENFEIDTPNLAYRAAYPGDYRIDVDAQRGVTRVTIHAGTGAVYGEQGQALTMGGGQQITFNGRVLEKLNVQEQPPQDNFDRWAAERNRREDQSVAARYVPRDVVGYQLLDASGEWRQDANDGPVWFPQGVPANWAPYRNGRWEWIAPWGWTWIDDAPWAFVTSHYGRWTQVGTRWAWAPGRLGLRPIYAPALVAFVGGGASPLAIGGKPTVAWFPLAPREPWQPPYRASAQYVSNVNANMPPLKEGGYAYQRNPQALTAIALDDFHRGKPSGGGWLRVAANMVAGAQVSAPPPMPVQRARTAVARAAAPASMPAPEIKQVTASSSPAPQQQEMAQQRKAAEQQKAEQQKAADQQRVAQQQRMAAQRAADQARREAAVAAKRVEQARREQQAKREQQANREQQARRAQEARRVAAAAAAKKTRESKDEKDEQRRRALHAQQVEQARRAADRDAQSLAQQRAAWQRQQEALAAQWRRDQQVWEEQQRAKAQRQRPGTS
jgi:hypothetical protein